MFKPLVIRVVKTLLPPMEWNTGRRGVVCLTIDDGPTPQITEWIHETLEEKDVKATFFCLAKNIEK